MFVECACYVSRSFVWCMCVYSDLCALDTGACLGQCGFVGLGWCERAVHEARTVRALVQRRHRRDRQCRHMTDRRQCLHAHNTDTHIPAYHTCTNITRTQQRTSVYLASESERANGSQVVVRAQLRRCEPLAQNGEIGQLHHTQTITQSCDVTACKSCVYASVQLCS